MYSGRLDKNEWEVRKVDLKTAQRLTEQYHYSKGGSNTAVYCHGLFRRNDESSECFGIAWWLPPTKSAAIATYPEMWTGVLSLSRLVILPGVPKNACTFLLSRSMKLINRDKWPCLVTYADSWQGHTGGIYKAVNWTFAGITKPSPVFVKDGRMVSRKAGPKTRTKAQMEQLGAVCVGSFPKLKFVHIVRPPYLNLL